MADKSVLVTPAWCPKTPTTQPTGSVIKNGEPGHPKRTSSPRAQDEVTYTTNNRLPKRDGNK